MTLTVPCLFGLESLVADEMRRLLEMERDFPDDEFVDVDYILSKLKIEGSFLEVEEVVLLRRALASAGDLRFYPGAR